MPGRLCIIGVGLIGGSLARAARSAELYDDIVGSGRNVANLQRAVELGVIDRYYSDPAEAVQGADVIVVAVPLGAMEAVFERIAPALSPAAVLTDVGSAKAGVIAAAERAFGGLPTRFVPGHPIAGTERSGVDASFAELFHGRRVILTPTSETDPGATMVVHALWQAVGARVMEMDVAHHDEVLAATSHLPHILAFTLVDTLAGMSERDEIFQYAAGGFRDFTRIASSDPVMWRDICLANDKAVLAMVERFQRDLSKFTELLRAADGERLKEIFERAKQARDRYSDK